MLLDELKPTLRLAIPVVLAELGWMSMGVVDTIMVGPLGPAAIGAAGVGNSLHMGFAIFGMGLLLGLDPLVSQAAGAGQAGEARAWLVHGVRLALVTTVPLVGVCFGVLAAIPWLGFHPEVEPLLRSYFAILLWSTPFLLLYAAFRRYLQGVHHVTPVMVALVSANLVNALGNWALVYGHLGLPAFGVPGSAIATLLSRVYMAVVLGVAAMRAGSTRWVNTRTTATPDAAARHGGARVLNTSNRRPWRTLVVLGLPAATTITAEVGVFTLATAMAGSLEPVAAASHQIALNIASVAFMIPLGLASAGAVRVGHALGAREPRRAAAAGWTTIAVGAAFTAATALLFVLAPRALIGLFTRDPAVLSLGASLLGIAAVFQIFDGLQGVTTGTLRGLGDTRTAMTANLTAHWLVGVPVGYTLCFRMGWGVRGLWWGLSIGLILVGAVLIGVWTYRAGRLRAGVA